MSLTYVLFLALCFYCKHFYNYKIQHFRYCNSEKLPFFKTELQNEKFIQLRYFRFGVQMFQRFYLYLFNVAKNVVLQ